jgi:predicted DsbA family dithiol-disulfide isomerase
MHIEIWADIVCPWCYVGKRRFEAALSQFEHRAEVVVTWRSFELDPQAPPAGEGSRNEHLARKYGMRVDQAAEMHRQMTELGAAEGIRFDFGASRVANSFDAHRLVHLAAAHGVQDQAVERLFAAHFAEGEVISDRATLGRLGADVGIPADELDEMLVGDAHAEDVRADERLAASAGIQAVPCFVVGRRMGASGAQDPERLLAFLRDGYARFAAA